MDYWLYIYIKALILLLCFQKGRLKNNQTEKCNKHYKETERKGVMVTFIYSAVMFMGHTYCRL